MVDGVKMGEGLFIRLPLIERTCYSQPVLVEDVCVDHGRANVLVSQQLLHRADVCASLEHVGGKGP